MDFDSMLRNYRLDNSRFLLNIFVVFGHFIGPWGGNLSQTKSGASFFLFHLIFTMPCLAFISGIFSSNIIISEKYNNMIEKFLIPYCIFNTILYFILVYLSATAKSEYFFFDANIQLWYLLSLISWRILLPLFTRIKFSFAIALILSIGIGYVDTLGAVALSLENPIDIRKDTLSIMRTFVLFPYFILGFYSKDFIKNLNTTHYFVPITFFVFLLIFCACLDKNHYYTFVQLAYGAYSFKSSGIEGSLAIIYRLLVFILALGGIYSFIYLIPNRQNFMTKNGQRSMYSYILHIFPAIAIAYLGVLNHIPVTDLTSILNVIFWFVISFIIAMLLTSHVVVKIFKPFIEPSGKWILRENKCEDK